MSLAAPTVSRSDAPARAGLVLLRAHPGRRGREPESRRRQRRAARHRQGVRLVADRARPDRRRLLARPGRSVLWLGALGDRYGRKLMLILGVSLSVPACLLAAYAPSDGVLVRRARARRRVGGHGVPDHARAHHRAVVGPAADHGRSRCGRRPAARSPPSGRWSPARCSSTSGGDRCSWSRFRWPRSRW